MPGHSMINMICLAIGSMAGGFSRYYLGGFVQRVSGSSFPYGTLVVNLMGCLIIGFIASVAGDRLALNAPGRILLISGFCGAFTTFSAFMVESDFLLRSGHTWEAAINVAVSLVCGFALYHLGAFLGKLV